MANICRTEIKIQAPTDAVQNIVDRLEGCVDGKYPNTENDKPHLIDEFGAKADDLIDRIGSKWVYRYTGHGEDGISEYGTIDDKDGFSELVFELESAWYPPSDMILEIYRQVVELSGDEESVRVFGSHWDEGYSPIGVFEIYYGQIIQEENHDLDWSEWDEKVEEEGESDYDRNFWDEEVDPAFVVLQKKLDKVMREI